MGPVNVTVQRFKRTHPFCTHTDKPNADFLLRDDLNASQLSPGTALGCATY